MRARGLALRGVLLAVLALATACRPTGFEGWTDDEVRELRSLSLSSLPAPLRDPSNAVADDPAAAQLGHRLFHDRGLSRDGTVACATCHQPERVFTDGLPRSRALGTTERNAPSIVPAAWGAWFFWGGRADSQWAQALGPLEHPAEHGATRTLVAHRVGEGHRSEYEAVFGPLPDLNDAKRFPRSAGPLGDEDERVAWQQMAAGDRDAVMRVFVNVGKAIAAYERTIAPGPGRFDAYVEALVARDPAAMRAALSAEEVEGLRLFVGDAKCTTCHSGPLLTNHEFANIGLPPAPGQPFDKGRLAGVAELFESEVTCLSRWSDAGEGDCVELRFVKSQGDELMGAMKVPSLRNVAETAPYAHSGQLATLRDVLHHYDEAPEPVFGHSDLLPLGFSDQQLAALEAFLRTLSGPLRAPPGFLEPPPAS